MLQIDKKDNRNLLHRNKLNAFRDWVGTKGYVIHPGSNHEYEVLRIEKRSPSGNTPHLVFYQKRKYQHVTIPEGAEELVREFIRYSRLEAFNRRFDVPLPRLCFK